MSQVYYFLKKYFLVFLITAVIVFGFWGLVYFDVISFNSFVPESQVFHLNSKEANLILDFGNGSQRAFRGGVVKGTTVLDILAAVSDVGNFDLDLSGKNGETIIEKIDGFAETSTKVWQIYINNQKIDTSPAKSLVKSGDEVRIVYEKPIK